MNRWLQAALCGALLGLLCGCGAPGAPIPPSLELPQPVHDLHAVRKGDVVTLTWTVPNFTTYHKTILNLGDTLVCRASLPTMSQCGAPVGRVTPPSSYRPASKRGRGRAPQPKIAASYTDKLTSQQLAHDPTGQISYAVTVLNQSGKNAGLSNVAEVSSAPALPPPSDFKAQVTADGVMLTWSKVDAPSMPGLRFIYRVYRRAKDAGKDVVVGEVPLASPPEFIDRDMDWEKAYQYRVDVASSSTSEGRTFEVEGEDTPLAQVVTHDIFPPAAPSGLQAVASTVGSSTFIDLIWSPVSDRDLAGYNIYRSEGSGAPVKLNSALVQTPAFRDSTASARHSYTYTVSAVDLRGNESGRSEPATEKVP